MTERTYDSAVLKTLLNIITICVIIKQSLIEILYEILSSIMAFIAIYAVKVPVWTRYYYVYLNSCHANEFIFLDSNN